MDTVQAINGSIVLQEFQALYLSGAVTSIRALRAVFVFSLFAGPMAMQTGLAFAQTTPGMFKDVPRPNPAYDVLKRLSNTGLITLYAEHESIDTRRMTRFEFAVHTEQIMKVLQQRLRSRIGHAFIGQTGDAQTESQIRDLRWLAQYFETELQALSKIETGPWTSSEARLEGIESLFNGLAPPFPDVPKDHWAFQSVESLRQKGVVKGYPDGRFRGAHTANRYEMAAALDELIKASLLTQTIRQRGEMGPAGTQVERGPAGGRGPQGPRGERPAEFDQIRKLLEALSIELRQLNVQLEDADHRTAGLRTEIKKPKDKFQ